MKRGDELHTLLIRGMVPGQIAAPEYIETVISHVFLFADIAYKVYKEDATAFNTHLRDLSKRAARNEFAAEDAIWNMHMSPHVYLPPQGIAVSGGRAVFVPLTEAAEVAVVSRRLDPAMVLFALLKRGAVSQATAVRLGAQLAQAENIFVPLLSPSTVGEHMMDAVEDVDRWGAHHAASVGDALWQRGMEFLREEHTRLFSGEVPLYPRFDIHTLNAFVIDDTLEPFDTMPAKGLWQWGPAAHNMFRIATDIAVFAGEETAQAFTDGWACATKRRWEGTAHDGMFWRVYTAMIMTPYFHMLASADSSKKSAAHAYAAFLERLLS